MSDNPLSKPVKRPRIGANGVTDMAEEPKEITVHSSPKQGVDIIRLNQHAIQELKKSMTYGVHYGPPYPGSDKDTLLKPGAEWAQKLFGIKPHFEELDKIIQPNFDDLSKSWVLFRYRCQMIEVASGLIIGEAIGLCHSLEDKHHWRNGKLKCPHCGQETLIISKRNQSVYWCNNYKGGCGKETPKSAPEITSQSVGKTVHSNPMDLANTLDKTAQKRAFVSAVLNATAASSIFAPGDDAIDDIDISDIVDAEFTEVNETPDTSPAEKPADKPEPKQEATEEKPAGLPKAYVDSLVDAIAYMYPDDKDGFHRRGTIKNLFEEGLLAEDTPGYRKLELITEHRAFKDLLMDQAMIYKALTVHLDNGETIDDWRGWYTAQKTMQEAWEACKIYHEEVLSNQVNDTSAPADPPGAPPVPESDVPF